MLISSIFNYVQERDKACLKMFSTVTLYRWSTKQTIPLSVLARNQTKGFGLEISGDRK